jgi:hypothetical protein
MTADATDRPRYVIADEVLLDEIASLRADLARARDDLSRAHAARGVIVASETGPDCADCGQPVTRNQAYQLGLTVDEVRHIHCPDPDERLRAAEEVIDVTRRWVNAEAHGIHVRDAVAHYDRRQLGAGRHAADGGQ